jgi:hypothetical protein
LNAFRIGFFMFGIGCLSLSVWLARRLQGAGANHARSIGSSLALVGWLLFIGFPTVHGVLNGPLLVIIAVAYPLVAIEAGRALAMRVFCWSSLVLNILACGCYWVLSLSAQNIRIQEGLLLLGVTVPPMGAVGVTVLQFAVGAVRRKVVQQSETVE